jgi:hypothetical protein
MLPYTPSVTGIADFRIYGAVEKFPKLTTGVSRTAVKGNDTRCV